MDSGNGGKIVGTFWDLFKAGARFHISPIMGGGKLGWVLGLTAPDNWGKQPEGGGE